jgi:hypothetical protein
MPNAETRRRRAEMALWRVAQAKKPEIKETRDHTPATKEISIAPAFQFHRFSALNVFVATGRMIGLSPKAPWKCQHQLRRPNDPGRP